MFGGGWLLLPIKLMMLFLKLKALLTELSLEDSPDKESTPTTHMILLSLIYDRIAMTVSVPEEKLNEILCFVELWLSKSSATVSRSLENYHTFVHVFAWDVFLCNVY